MAEFSDRWLDELKSKNDIVDVASQYTVLKQSGHRHIGLCPIHGEKTPSFNVDSDKQLFYCFGCGRGGTVIQLVMECEHMSFPDAVETLAKRVNMPMPKQTADTAAIHRERALRDRLRDMNREAAQFYHKCLMDSDGEQARKYLTDRQIPYNMVIRFGLGYAPDKWTALKDHLLEKGYTIEEMVKGSLAVQKGNDAYDLFRNRIMFPIIDRYNHVIAFGGRVMGKGEPKYLNSRETPVFDKGANLYAANLIRKKGTVDYIILCEGYIDVISLHNAGIDTAVASLGTAFTQGQARLIKRYTQNVYISYDGDGAGQRAALKALDILAKEGCRVKVLSYPDGMDPDDFVRKKGGDGLRQLMKTALSEPSYRESLVAVKYDLKDPNVYGDYATEAVTAMKPVTDPIQLESGLKIISSKTGYTLETLYEQLGSGRKRVKDVSAGIRINAPPSNKLTKGRDDAAQAKTLALMIDDRAMRRRIVEENWGKLFSDDHYRKLYELLAEMPVDENIDAGAVALRTDDETAKLLSELLIAHGDLGDRKKLFADCGFRLREAAMEKEIDAVKALLAKSRTGEEIRKNAGELQKLNLQLQELRKEAEGGREWKN